MSNLTPEKRLDRNGKLVTRHVRGEAASGAGRSSMPAPALATRDSKAGAKKAFKPRRRQLEPYQLSMRVTDFPSTDPLTTAEQRQDHVKTNSYTYFTVNDVEVFDVLSAVNTSGNALELMCNGVRSSEEARDYLSNLGASELIADKNELMQQALERGLDPYTFITNYESVNDKERASDYLIDALEFMSTSLNDGASRHIKDEIIKGNVAYRDIKEIGITKLKARDRGYELISALTALNKGEANYSVDDIKHIIDRHQVEKNSISFHIMAEALYYNGPEAIQNIDKMLYLDAEHYAYVRGNQSRAYDGKTLEERYSLLTYAAQVKSKLNIELIGEKALTDGFHDAGIPIDVAVETINSGGTVNQAIAIHENGVEKSLSSGWL